MSAIEYFARFAALPDRVIANARIAVVDGRITAVDTAAPGAGATELAGTVLPGLLDLQVNGAGGRSVDELTDDALSTVAAAVWAGGAAAFLPTLITAPWATLLERTAAVAAWIERHDGAGATPLGLHVEGPFLTATGVHDEACFVDPTPDRIAALLAAAGGHLRLVTLASDRPGAADAVRELRRHGVATAIGHVRSDAGFDECVAAGATLVTHLFNAMQPMHHRQPGVPGRALDERRLGCTLIVDGEHVHPAMVRNAFAILGADRTILVSDAVAAAGMPDGEYTLADIKVESRDGVVRDAAGRLAGSALTMGAAVRNFLRFVPDAGPWTAAHIAATNPARAIGVTDHGALQVGRRAVFTVLADDGSVRTVG